MAVRRDGVLNEILDEVFKEVLAATFAACFVVACGGNAPARAMEQQGAHACGGNEVARGTVSRIVDGRTFVLDDGREIRLAAIEVPPLSPPSNRATHRTAKLAPLRSMRSPALIKWFSAAPRSLPITTGGWSLMPIQCGTATSFSCRGSSSRTFCPCRRPGRARLRRGTFESREDRPKGKAWPLGRSVL